MIEHYFNYTQDRTDFCFEFFYITQNKKVDAAFLENLKEKVLLSYRSIEELKFHLSESTEDEIKKYVTDYVIPENASIIDRIVRQGDWGEIVAGLIVANIQKLSIPIHKLRWKINKNKSVFGTDLIAFNLGDPITDIHYYEIKTRVASHQKEGKNPNRNYISIIAHNSLAKENNMPNEMLADFLMRYYVAQNDYASAAKFKDIVKNPSAYNRNFELFFIVEENNYTDTIFDELHNLPPQLAPLRVTVIIVNDLQKIIDETWQDIEQRLVDMIKT